MSYIDMCAHHSLPREEAQSAADELASDLARKFDIDYDWNGDHIHFERPGVNGVITAVSYTHLTLPTTGSWGGGRGGRGG